VNPTPPSPTPPPRAAEPSAGHGESPARGAHYVVLTGNPNCGKTTVFNALTGLRAKVGNYAGVTVERKEGRLLGAPTGLDVRLLDLPGTYSLSPQSLDEQISRDVLLNRLSEVPAASLIVAVVDGSNLQRNLYYTTQVIELGYPTLVALNMVDVAKSNGHDINTTKLEAALGVRVVPLVASEGQGIPELRAAMVGLLKNPVPHAPREFGELPSAFENEGAALADLLKQEFPGHSRQAAAEAILILSNEKALSSSQTHYPDTVVSAVNAARLRLENSGLDWRGLPIESRYTAVASIQQSVTAETAPPGESFSDKLDRILTHKVWGTLVFIAVMTLMFQSIFTFARIPMEALQNGVDWLGGQVANLIPPGDLNSLLVEGIIAGVGAVIVFLPQILLLFLFIGFLEDTGYMARAAFLMDRLMSKVGLHGKSFIPMLSSFACAIPGVMATRTIESPKDRLVTILVAPLMSCSARLPVYTLLIAACIPDRTVFGVLKLAGLTMLAMYLIGIVAALLMAWLFKKTLLKGEVPMLIMELPPYKRPLLRVVLRHMWDRSRLFLRRAGTVILSINVLLWCLATYPRSSKVESEFNARRAALTGAATAAAQPQASDAKSPDPATAAKLAELDNEEAGLKLRSSFAGYLGRSVAPFIAPLGLDWKMGIGIVASFAAREVFVSTMSTVYSVGKYQRSETGMSNLARTLQSQKKADGTPVYTMRTGITLMVFYVFALQCVSTVAIVRRETNSWKWPFFQWVYMGALAWAGAFLAYHLGGLFGW
jgi:ferrous iron transport protein B